mmetsp:Transcript_15460/g.48312  ORF Transcript_15460/g.48312 Transcript_15460/m.48312 type:complete len:222 (+) Transcript_15460:3383-4048(+)
MARRMSFCTRTGSVGFTRTPFHASRSSSRSSAGSGVTAGSPGTRDGTLRDRTAAATVTSGVADSSRSGSSHSATMRESAVRTTARTVLSMGNGACRTRTWTGEASPNLMATPPSPSHVHVAGRPAQNSSWTPSTIWYARPGTTSAWTVMVWPPTTTGTVAVRVIRLDAPATTPFRRHVWLKECTVTPVSVAVASEIRATSAPVSPNTCTSTPLIDPSSSNE